MTTAVLDPREAVARHEVILKEHERRLGEIKDEIHETRRGNGDISEMFGKIMAATTHTADQVVALDSTLRNHAERVDRRFIEMKVEQERVCALKHGAIEQRFVNVETSKDKIERKVEDMGENTKITYIKQLQSELEGARQSQTVVKAQRFEWRKLWFTSVVGLIMAVVAAGLTYTVTVASQKAAAKQAAVASQGK